MCKAATFRLRLRKHSLPRASFFSRRALVGTPRKCNFSKSRALGALCEPKFDNVFKNNGIFIIGADSRAERK